MLRVLDLFAGIGGFSFGLEMTGGFETVAFCEIEKYPQEILKKNFPGVPIYEDIRELNSDRLDRDGIGRIDVITGGYPCQPFSVAGKQKGEADDRHLWPFMLEIIAQVRPAWVICENVSGHIALGLDQVLFDLENECYATRTFIVPACAVNAPHRRDRLWIVAHTERDGFAPAEKQRGVKKTIRGKQKGSERTLDTEGASGLPATGEDVADSDTARQCTSSGSRESNGETWDNFGRSGENVADSDKLTRGSGEVYRKSGDKGRAASKARGEGLRSEDDDSHAHHPATRSQDVADSGGERLQGSERLRKNENKNQSRKKSPHGSASEYGDDGRWFCIHWSVEPNVGRVADGIPRRVAKLKALGNAVVPQIPMMIGQAILDYENDNRSN